MHSHEDGVLISHCPSTSFLIEIPTIPKHTQKTGYVWICIIYSWLTKRYPARVPSLTKAATLAKGLLHLPDGSFQLSPIRAAHDVPALSSASQCMEPLFLSLCYHSLHTPWPHSAAVPTGLGLAVQLGSHRGQRVGLVLSLKAWHSFQLSMGMGQLGPPVCS